MNRGVAQAERRERVGDRMNREDTQGECTGRIHRKDTQGGYTGGMNKEDEQGG
jgi:hypothetical protein